MSLRRFTDYILQGRVHALVAAFVLGFVPVFGTFGSIIAAFVTLRKSIHDGALIFIFTTLPTLLLVTLPADPNNGTFALITVIVMTVVINFLSWLSAVILKLTSSWSLVLDVLGLLGVLVVITLHLADPNLAQFWEHWTLNYVASMKEMLGSAADYVSANIVNNIHVIKDYLTGQVTLILGSCSVLILLAARWWQDAVFNPGGLRKELMEVRLSKVSALVTLACFALSFMHVVMTQDALPIMLLFYAFAGLSLMHYVIFAKNMNWSWLVIIYVGLLFAPFVLIVAGLLDTVFDFRKRLPVRSLTS
jgi:hypothetical protein